MKKNFTVKIVHHPDDPSCWIVHVYKPAFPFKKKITSKLFNSKEEMKKFVEKLQFEDFSERIN